MENKVRETRVERKMSQVDLAERTGVSRQTIHSIETSRYVPSVELALKIAKTLHMSVEKLFIIRGEK